jgi:hypothetical protein
MIEMISALSRRYEAGDPYQPHHFCMMFIDLAITKTLGETRTKSKQTRDRQDRQETREDQTRKKKPTGDRLF